MKKSKPRVSFKVPPIGPQYAGQAMTKGQQMVKNPVTKDAATAKITEMIQQSGMPPEMFVEMGRLAEASIKDPKRYQDFVNYMVTKRLEKAEDIAKPDYQMLASLAVIGKVAETMAPAPQGI